MKSTFSVIYYLKRQVVKKDGTVPVMGRITGRNGAIFFRNRICCVGCQ